AHSDLTVARDSRFTVSLNPANGGRVKFRHKFTPLICSKNSLYDIFINALSRPINGAAQITHIFLS
ncbi:MAG: hypothetical protein K2L72_02480, partial [Clostridia bacterium]|nr:hypothetical protein [Clostridia bacterium]